MTAAISHGVGGGLARGPARSLAPNCVRVRVCERARKPPEAQHGIINLIEPLPMDSFHNKSPLNTATCPIRKDGARHRRAAVLHTALVAAPRLARPAVPRCEPRVTLYQSQRTDVRRFRAARSTFYQRRRAPGWNIASSRRALEAPVAAAPILNCTPRALVSAEERWSEDAPNLTDSYLAQTRRVFVRDDSTRAACV